MLIQRVAGDNYPIDVIFKQNGSVVDLTGSTVSFQYGAGMVIVGLIIDATSGQARFLPAAGDFQTAGKVTYKIKRTINGITTTHLRGDLTLMS